MFSPLIHFNFQGSDPMNLESCRLHHKIMYMKFMHCEQNQMGVKIMFAHSFNWLAYVQLPHVLHGDYCGNFR